MDDPSTPDRRASIQGPLNRQPKGLTSPSGAASRHLAISRQVAISAIANRRPFEALSMAPRLLIQASDLRKNTSPAVAYRALEVRAGGRASRSPLVEQDELQRVPRVRRREHRPRARCRPHDARRRIRPEHLRGRAPVRPRRARTPCRPRGYGSQRDPRRRLDTFRNASLRLLLRALSELPRRGSLGGGPPREHQRLRPRRAQKALSRRRIPEL